MTNYYIPYNEYVSPFVKPIAIKVTNNYLIKFINSDDMYYMKYFLDDLKNWYFIDDPLNFQTILCVLDDGDIYLIENKY